MNRFLDSLKGLGALRLLGIAGVGLAVLAIVGAMALRSGTQAMALLYGELDLRDSAQVTATLDKLHASYELKGGGTQIFVPSDQVDRLRLALARDGLPTGGSVGYEVFDRGDSLTSNQFQQGMNQLRALEGELGRTIRSIRGIRNARVHLVLAKREPFAREQQEAQASIVVSMTGAQRMGDEEVQAVVNLVSTAVPGLKPQNISVVDSRGQLLARPGRGSEREGGPRTTDDARRAMEQRLGQAVEDMLGRTLGPGHVRAEASVELDFDRVNEMREQYDPDGQVVRSQQTVADTSKNTEAAPAVSVQNNLPNPEGQAAGTGGAATSRQEGNTTYEIGKTIRTLVHDTPSIKKVSMAVLVDGTTTRGPDGKAAWQELSQPDLDRIAMLVRSAIGFDERRGDRVEVVNMRFSMPPELGDAEPAGPAWLQLGKADIMSLATVGAAVLVALFALGFVFRPLALRLAAGLPSGAPALAAPPALMLGGAAGTQAGLLSGSGPTPLPIGTMQGGLVPAGLPDDAMMNVTNIKGEVRASSIRKLGEMVETQPEATVTVIRGWLQQKAS